MKLLTINVDSSEFHRYADAMTSGRGDEVLFVDFDNTSEQWGIIKSSPKSVRLIIFDRYSQVDEKKFEYLLNRDAILLEPVLTPRFGFMFMPYFVDKLDLPLSTWDKPRPFDIGYKGSVLSTETEACLLKAIKELNDIKVGVSVKNKLHDSRYQTLKEIITFGKFGWSRFSSTLVTGNHQQYSNGVMPDITNHLKYGVIPLVYHKHRWFHALFKNFLVFDSHDIGWYRNMYKHIHYGMMDELYKNIETYMPQMITENFVSTIVTIGEG